MIRWLTVACGFVAIAVGLAAYIWVRVPRPLSLEGALDPATLPTVDYVRLAARPDLSRKLYAIHANSDVTKRRELLSRYPPDHGLPLLKPDSPPETSWDDLINAGVVVDVPAVQSASFFVSEARSYGARRVLVPLEVERKNIWALSQSHISSDPSPRNEEQAWLRAKSFSGRLHRFKDYKFAEVSFAEVETYIGKNLPAYANVAEAWIIVQTDGRANRNSSEAWHFYVPVEGSGEKIWLQLRNSVDSWSWHNQVAGSLVGLWLPPGGHKFEPDPGASVALLQLDGDVLRYRDPDASWPFLARRWSSHWGRYLLWSGPALFGVAGLMFLYWHLYRRVYQPGLPELLRPFEDHILLDPVWRSHLRVVSGLLFALLAFASVAVGVVARGTMRRNAEASLGTLDLIAHAATFSFVLCVILVISFMARSGVAILRSDTRKPVLYLRPFSTDVWLWDSWRDLLVTVLTGMRDTAERSLSRAVRNIGPLVAIGKPGDRIPPLGAARLYVGDDHWQEVVQQVASEACLVILRIGRSEGFWWELKYLVASVDPRRVLIYLPPRDRRRLYPEFRDRAVDVMPHPLPQDAGRALLLGFREGWAPYLVDGDGPSGKALFRRWALYAYLAPAVGEALQKVMGSLGVAMRPLELSTRERMIVFGWATAVIAILMGRI